MSQSAFAAVVLLMILHVGSKHMPPSLPYLMDSWLKHFHVEIHTVINHTFFCFLYIIVENNTVPESV